MNPYLFNLVLTDMEEMLKRGGVKLEEEKVFCLAYADDMVLLAENEEGMVHMIEKLKGYIDKKRLEVNVGKTKVMRFKRRREEKSGKVEVEGEGDRGGEGIHVFRL